MVKPRIEEESGSEEEPEIGDEEVEPEEPDEEVTTSTPNSTSNSLQKIFIAHKSIEEIGWNGTKAFTLPHPRTQAQALFLLDMTDKFNQAEHEDPRAQPPFLYEVLTMAEPFRSWFVDDTVISNGNIYTLTPVDPLFMILPVIAKSKKAMPFADHLAEAFPAKVGRVLCRRISTKQLQNIAIRKVAGDIEAFIYSEELTLTWLSEKARKASQFLSQKGINGSEASVSVNFAKSSSSDEVKEISNGSKIKVEYLQYGCDIVGDYVEDSLKRKLLTKFGLPTEPDRSKRKNNDTEKERGLEGNRKKLKVTDNVQPLEDYGCDSPSSNSASKALGRGSAKEKELQKAAQGTRSLLSFFGKKT